MLAGSVAGLCLLLCACSLEDDRDICCGNIRMEIRYVPYGVEELATYIRSLRHFVFDAGGRFVREIPSGEPIRMLRFSLPDGDYTLQSGDDCILYAALQGPYADAETFAADCMAVMQRAADDGLGFTCYHFNADEDIDDGISYYLDCVASYPAGLTAAQVAQRVQASYHYDNNSFSSEADRDDYIRRQLQNEISDEYADRHDGAYPDEKYLNEETERRFAERTGMATPESAQA